MLFSWKTESLEEKGENHQELGGRLPRKNVQSGPGNTPDLPVASYGKNGVREWIRIKEKEMRRFPLYTPGSRATNPKPLVKPIRQSTGYGMTGES
ncbi:hypothetical protein J2741_000868 [Methanolinea mesophila]|nr:hypothetical protein [Methanolinea mesophila]